MGRRMLEFNLAAMSRNIICYCIIAGNIFIKFTPGQKLFKNDKQNRLICEETNKKKMSLRQKNTQTDTQGGILY